MISKESMQLMKMLKEQYVPIQDWTTMDYEMVRAMFDANITDGKIPDGIEVVEEVLGGRPVERLIIPEASEKIIMHIHGGGMVMGNERAGRFMLGHVGYLSHRNTISINYRLCPEYAYPAAVEDCVDVYRALLSEGYQPENIAFLGESAGGMLVTALLAYIKRNDLPMPGCACTISGSVDAEYASQSMIRNRESEIVVNANLKEMMQALYYQNIEPGDPVASPIASDLTGWPPMYLFACREEILLDESIRMYIKLQEAGVETDITIQEGMFHTYMMYDLPESFEAFEKIAAFLNRH